MADPYTQMMSPEAMTGPVQDPNQVQPTPPAYAQMMNPVGPMLQQMQRPAATPEEFTQRISGWTEVVKHSMSNPNFQRALGVFGQHMMQPIQPGQSPLGATANSIGMGRTAYEFGEEAELARAYREAEERRKEGKETRETAESRASVASTEAGTEGKILNNRVAKATEADKIRASGLEIEQAQLNIKKGKTEEERNQILLKESQRIAKIISELPPGILRQAEIDKITEPTLKAEVQRSQILAHKAAAGDSAAGAKLKGAQTKLVGAQAEQEDLETADLKATDPEKRKEARLAKMRGHLGGQSAQVAQAEYHKAEYKRAYPQQPGETPEAFEQRAAQEGLKASKTAKGKETADLWVTWDEKNRQTGETDEQSIARFQKLLGMIAGEKPGTQPPPGGDSNPRRVRKFDAKGNEIK